jgi:microcystin-dependent protein
MTGEFVKPVKIYPAIVGQIADPDIYNQNIAAQSKGTIIPIDVDGNYSDGDLGDESKGLVGALITTIKMRSSGIIKLYDAFGVFIKDLSFEQVPPGTIMYYAKNTPPAGYFECDGSVVSQITYLDLYSIIGSTFNIGGEGAGNFRIPDLRGYFLRGWDNGRGIDTGRTFGSNQAHAAEKHRHFKGEAVTNETPDGKYNGNGLTINGVTYGSSNQSGSGGFSSFSSSVQVPAVSGGTVNVASENRPVNTALLPCIKY